MRLTGDIKSERLLYWKGYLFGVLALFAGSILLLEHPDLRTAALLAICVWASCRFYYFLFYVIEKYADPSFKFAGLGSFIRYRVGKRRTRSLAANDHSGNLN
jgi:hypothetical protein